MKRFAGTIVATAYLCANVMGVYAVETNFWTERRSRVSEQKATRSSPQMCARLQNIPIQPIPFASVANAQHVLLLGFAETHKNLFEALSPTFGTIRHVWFPTKKINKSPLILHIQDVHMNQDAQRNIARVVESLTSRGVSSTVALEGIWGPINIKPFQEYENRQAVKRTADYLLKGNEISGPIYSGMQGKGTFVGIDDRDHYTANVEAYKQSIPLIPSVKADLEEQVKWVKQKKVMVFSPELHSLDRVVEGYRQGTTKFGDYVQTIANKNTQSPEIQKFLKALNYEQTIDFQKVEEERVVLIDKLVQRLSKTQINELTAHAVSHRSGQMGIGNFYSYLQTLCQSSGVRLEEFPAMDEYIKYTLLAETIDGEVLLNDVNNLEKKAYTALTKTVEQAELVQESRQLSLTEKLVDFSLTPAEWKEYQKSPKENLKTFESFYREADVRDAAMALNVLKENAGDVTILVTGGFHAEGMTKKLTEAGATVINFVPKIKKINVASGSAYLSVFNQAKTPLEKLMQGEKLFLAQNPAKGFPTQGPLGVIAEDLVSHVKRPLQKLKLADEIKQRIKKFLKDTTGQDLTVEFDEIAIEHNQTKVTLPIKIGDRTFDVEVTLDNNSEIISIEKVNSESLLAPSRLAEVALRWIVRLHHTLDLIQKKTFTGQPAHTASRWTKSIAHFSEVLILAGVPQWRGAHIAWFLSSHDFKNIEELVWLLAGLHSIRLVQVRNIKRDSAGSITRWVQAIRSQMGTHAHFQKVSPVPLAASVRRTKPDEFRRALEECVADPSKLPFPVREYPNKYHVHAVYFLLRDMQNAGIIGAVGAQTAANVINKTLGNNLFKGVTLRPALFWDAVEWIRLDPVRYVGVEGMIRLAMEINKKGSVHLCQIFSAFGSDRAFDVIKALTEDDVTPLLGGTESLGWEYISLPYEVIEQLARAILLNPNHYMGVEGMLRLAKLNKTNLGHIFTAFGGGRGLKVIKELTGQDIPPQLNGDSRDLGWEYIAMPYEAVEQLAHTILLNPSHYMGVEGMVRLAKLNRTNLSNIFSAFGGDRGLRVIKELTGEDINPFLGGAKDLGWETIRLPYETLKQIADTILLNPSSYLGIGGMLRLAKLKRANVGHIFSAFGGERGLKVIKELTGQDIAPPPDGGRDLGWEKIDMPYETMEQLALKILLNPSDYMGVEGMLRLASFNNTHLQQIFGAFGGDRGPKVIKELTGQDVAPSLGGAAAGNFAWEYISMPYETIKQLANTILSDPSHYSGVEGMVRLAKLHRTHLMQISIAFGGARGLKVIKELTGRDIRPLLGGDRDLGWKYINLPYETMEQLANTILSNPSHYVGVEGMLRLAKFNRTHLWQIFSAFGNERGLEVIKELTGRDLSSLLNGNKDLGWEIINMPYDTLSQLAYEISRNPNRFATIEGMVRLAHLHQTNFNEIFTAFGKNHGPKVIHELTGTSIPNPLSWSRVDLPFLEGVRELRNRGLISEEFLQTLSPGAWAVVWKWLELKIPQSPWGVAGLFAGFGAVEGLITWGIGMGAREWIGPLGLSLGFPLLVPVVAALGVWALINLNMHSKGLFVWDTGKKEWRIISPKESRGPPSRFFSAIAVAASSLFGLYLAIDPTIPALSALLWATVPHAVIGFMLPLWRAIIPLRPALFESREVLEREYSTFKPDFKRVDLSSFTGEALGVYQFLWDGPNQKFEGGEELTKNLESVLQKVEDIFKKNNLRASGYGDFYTREAFHSGVHVFRRASDVPVSEEDLSNARESTKEAFKGGVSYRINFNRVYFNNNTLLAAGFVEDPVSLSQGRDRLAARPEDGLERKRMRIVHISLARFSKEIPSAVLREIQKLLEGINNSRGSLGRITVDKIILATHQGPNIHRTPLSIKGIFPLSSVNRKRWHKLYPLVLIAATFLIMKLFDLTPAFIILVPLMVSQKGVLRVPRSGIWDPPHQPIAQTYRWVSSPFFTCWDKPDLSVKVGRKDEEGFELMVGYDEGGDIIKIDFSRKEGTRTVIYNGEDPGTVKGIFCNEGTLYIVVRDGQRLINQIPDKNIQIIPFSEASARFMEELETAKIPIPPPVPRRVDPSQFVLNSQEQKTLLEMLPNGMRNSMTQGNQNLSFSLDAQASGAHETRPNITQIRFRQDEYDDIFIHTFWHVFSIDYDPQDVIRSVVYTYFYCEDAVDVRDHVYLFRQKKEDPNGVVGFAWENEGDVYAFYMVVRDSLAGKLGGSFYLSDMFPKFVVLTESEALEKHAPLMQKFGMLTNTPVPAISTPPASSPGGSNLGARASPWYHMNAHHIESRGHLSLLGLLASGVVIGITLMGLIPLWGAGWMLVFVAPTEVFTRLHKTMNRVAMSAHALALLVKVGQTPEVSVQEAKTLLKGLLREDGEFLGGKLGQMGSLQSEPDMQDVAAYMNAKLHSPNPVMRFFAKRVLLRELTAVGVSVNATLLNKFLQTFDAGSGSRLRDAFQNREVTLFVPPDTSRNDLHAVALLTRVFNVDRLAVVVEEGQVADVTGVLNKVLPGTPWATVVPVPKDSFQKEDAYFSLKLSEGRWSHLAAALPSQGQAMSFGDVRLIGAPSGTVFDRFVREGIKNIFKILPEASLRVGTILNLEGIVAALAAA